MFFQSADNGILINWNDNHRSEYSYEWLKSRSFSEKSQKQYLENIYRPKKKLWNNDEFFKIMHLYEYNDILTE